MPKNTKILLSIALILSVLAYISLNKGNKKDTIESEDAQFAVADSGSVDKIELITQSGTVSLLNANGTWSVDNAYKADVNKLAQLCTFIYKVQATKPVYKELENKINRQIRTKGIKINAYVGNELVRQYTVALDSANAYTAYGKIGNVGNLYTLEIPGGEIKLAKLFDNQPILWKDKTVFNSLSRNINRVKIAFSATPKDGFELVSGLTKFEVVGMPKSDSVKIKSFLELFKNVEVKSYITENQANIRDSLLKIAPSFSISLEDRMATKSNSIKIFYQPKQNGEIYGLLGSSDELVSIRPMIFEYILQKRSFFEVK